MKTKVIKMYKFILVFLFVSLGLLNLQAQCYPGGVTFSRQTQIDSFRINNPTCKKILGFCKISENPNSPILKLDSLIGVDEIVGPLIISQNKFLTNLSGLDSLHKIAGNLQLSTNNQLNSLTALAKLKTIGFNLQVDNNPELINFSGLTVSTIGNAIFIGTNVKMENLVGLEAIKEVNAVSIDNSKNLVNLKGLENLKTIKDSIELKQLESLTSISDLTSLTSLGKVHIRNTGITSLIGLGKLTKINGYLDLRENDALTSLSALSGIDSIKGRLVLVDCGIKNLEGLDNVSEVGGQVEIGYNLELQNLEGLNKLRKVDGFLSILHNPKLQNITALMELDSVVGDFIWIFNNDSLTTLSGLDNLFYIKGSSINIRDNDMLSVCGIPSICYHIQYADFVNMYNNALGCNGIAEIENTCGGTSVIQGFVFQDKNKNCQFDPGEIPLEHWPVIAVNGLDTLVDYTDAEGIYKVFAQAGTYQVQTFPPTYWTETCTGIKEISLGGSAIEYVNFYGQEDIPCPAMQVDISATKIKACDKAIFYVDYCNQGTNASTESSVKVTFDDEVTIDSSSLSYADLGANTFEFDLGNVVVGACDKFSIYGHISCDLVEEQVICASAKIFPETFCGTPNPNWSKASIKITGSCTDSVRFKIENIGDEPTGPHVFDLVIEDWILLHSEKELPSGGSDEFAFPKDGKTYTVRTKQMAFHPGNSNPLVSIEGCTDMTTFSTGYVAQFPEDDGDTFISIDCQETNFDSQNQSNFPKGYGPKHYIERGQDIEYKVNFQNANLDSIQNVVIKVAVSPYLDLTTMQIGARTHPYTLKIINDTLVMHFASIDLPPSESNPIKSQGFVKFKLSQKPNLPNGTVIENNAFVFYGRDAAIETNSVFNTIGEDFVLVELFNPANNNLNISVSPNPFKVQTKLLVEGIEFSKGQFLLFDQSGKTLRKIEFNNNSFDLFRENLPAGLYPIQIILDDKTVVNGQVIVL